MYQCSGGDQLAGELEGGCQVHTGVIDRILQVMIYFTIQYKVKNISTNTFLAEEQDVLDLDLSIELIAPLSVAGEELSAGVR